MGPRWQTSQLGLDLDPQSASKTTYPEAPWQFQSISESVQLFSLVQLFVTPWTAARQASPSTGACSNSCPSSWWCHPTISSSVVPFSSRLQSFSASGSQSIGASASILSMNTQDWLPLGSTGLNSLQSKGLSSLLQHHSSKVWTFGTKLSLWSNSHMVHPYMTTRKSIVLTRQTFLGKGMPL